MQCKCASTINVKYKFNYSKNINLLYMDLVSDFETYVL